MEVGTQAEAFAGGGVAGREAPAAPGPILSLLQELTEGVPIRPAEKAARLSCALDLLEDDPDNRSIADGIVPEIREEKCRRRFILATHTANIPVPEDAELIAALVPAESEGGSKSISQTKTWASSIRLPFASW